MEQQEKKEISDYLRMVKIEKTFLLASFPFIGYLITYVYQINFLKFFDIPNEFFQVNIENIISSTVLILLISILISICIFLVILFFNKLPKAKPKEYKDPTLLSYNTVAIIVLLIPLLMLYNFNGIILKISILLSFWIILIFLIYGRPYIYFPKETSFLETIKKYSRKVYEEKQEKQKELPSQNKLSIFLFQPPYFGYTTYLVVITVVIFISFVVGVYIPTNQENFYILNENGKNYIFVGLYDKQLLTVSFDVEKKITTREIKIVPLSSMSDFTYQNTGRINLYKSNNK